MDPAYDANGQAAGAVQYDQNGMPIQDPNAYQQPVQQVDPNYYQQYQDPNAYQQYVDPNAAAVDPNQVAADGTVVEEKPKKEKGKSFLYYLFQFIIVGFSYLSKYGTDAFNPNAMLESVTTNPDGTVVMSKTSKRIEQQKDKIRNNPRNIALKKKLAEQLAQEGVTNFLNQLFLNIP